MSVWGRFRKIQDCRKALNRFAGIFSWISPWFPFSFFEFLENQETCFLHGAGQKNSEQVWDGLTEASEEISDPSDVSAADEIQAQRKKRAGNFDPASLF